MDGAVNMLYDIAIVGGGPVGATLALALRGYGFSVVVLEAHEAGTAKRDARTLALSQGSRLILEKLGVWEALQHDATSIETIHVSQRGRFGRTVLQAHDEGQVALGYVIAYAALCDAIDARLGEGADCNIEYGVRAVSVTLDDSFATVVCEKGGGETAFSARMVVVADGGRGLGELPGMHRESRDYGQSALVCHVESELPHANVAYERFTPHGPVALLPEGVRGFALVWTAAPENAATLCSIAEQDFLSRLHRHFGDRVGRFLSVSGRAIFPLKLSKVRPVTGRRIAVIGNAAQTLHPVAGQGFNLGLRDAWELAMTVRDTAREAVGEAPMLERYRVRRRLDTDGGIFFTDFLVRGFSNDYPGFGKARGLGLAACELLAPARHFVAGKMSFGA